jgi:glyoxylase-like metal-dependent hydrolase (beta-lactamase superfamily II)
MTRLATKQRRLGAGEWLRLEKAELAYLEGGCLRFPYAEFFAPSLATPAYRKGLAAIGEEVILPVAWFVVRSPSALTVVDTGMPSPGVGTSLAARLRPLGIRPRDVDFVVLSHLHSDHIGGLIEPDSGEPSFPRAEHICHERDLAWWGSRAKPERAKELERIRPQLSSIATQEHRLVDDVHTSQCPGHTPGHLTVEIGGRGSHAEARLMADLFHLPTQLKHPELLSFADVIPNELLRRREEVMAGTRDKSPLTGFAHFPGHLGHLTRIDGRVCWRPYGFATHGDKLSERSISER